MKMMPNDPELESVVLGCALVEQSSCDIVMEMLSEEVFYRPAHQTIFRAIREIRSKKDPVDLMTVTNELRKVKMLDAVGGAYFITQLTNKAVNVSNMQTYCMHLLEKFMRRQIITTSQEAQRKAYDDYFDPIDNYGEMKKSLGVIDSILNTGKVSSTDQIYQDTIKIMTGQATNERSFGLHELDNLLIGVRPGFKYTIGARPGMGKTSLIKTFAINLVQAGSPGIIFSLEQPSVQIMTQIISGYCQISNERIQKKLLSAEEIQMIGTKMKTFRNDLLIIDDDASATINSIERKVKKLKQTHNIEWFMVDYIQLMISSVKGIDRKGKMKEEIVGDLTRGLKNIAKANNVAAFELSQLSRPEKGTRVPRPSLSDLKDSGEIEASADVVMFIHRPEYYGVTEANGKDLRGMAEIIISKNRHGAQGSAVVKYIKEQTQFVNQEDVRISQEESNPIHF